jgi:CMP-N-acetylneuraminic acid synthetase
MRRQDLPKVYRRNGAIFIVTRDFYANTRQLWGGKTGLVEMPESRSIDIDTIDDLDLARHALKNKG